MEAQAICNCVLHDNWKIKNNEIFRIKVIIGENFRLYDPYSKIKHSSTEHILEYPQQQMDDGTSVNQQFQQIYLTTEFSSSPNTTGWLPAVGESDLGLSCTLHSIVYE